MPPKKMPPPKPQWRAPSVIALCVGSFSIGVATADAVKSTLAETASFATRALSNVSIPQYADLFPASAYNALPDVLKTTDYNGTSVFVPPGKPLAGMTKKPFHIYDDAFLSIIGSDPTLTVIAETEKDPVFHEAVVWSEKTDEAFFCQNAGALAAGTGLKKSAIIEKVDLKEAREVAASGDPKRRVKVQTVPTTPMVLNPNGATMYGDDIIFAGEGMGQTASALYLVNASPPYNTTVLINNFYGRQFNSLNDVAVNSRNKDIYFTDPTYGYVQDFRPNPALPNMVYRLNMKTKAVTAVADGFVMPNGINFSPDGKYAYITDTGTNLGFKGHDYTGPSAIYRFNVAHDGTFENRKLFAFVSEGVPDGIHLDTKGNVYAGCGDGVHVWNPAGTFLGKIFTGMGVANFNFMGCGRMVIAAETKLFYATLAATGQANISP